MIDTDGNHEILFIILQNAVISKVYYNKYYEKKLFDIVELQNARKKTEQKSNFGKIFNLYLII